MVSLRRVEGWYRHNELPGPTSPEEAPRPGCVRTPNIHGLLEFAFRRLANFQVRNLRKSGALTNGLLLNCARRTIDRAKNRGSEPWVFYNATRERCALGSAGSEWLKGALPTGFNILVMISVSRDTMCWKRTVLRSLRSVI